MLHKDETVSGQHLASVLCFFPSKTWLPKHTTEGISQLCHIGWVDNIFYHKFPLLGNHGIRNEHHSITLLNPCWDMTKRVEGKGAAGGEPFRGR